MSGRSAARLGSGVRRTFWEAWGAKRGKDVRLEPRKRGESAGSKPSEGPRLQAPIYRALPASPDQIEPSSHPPAAPS